MIHCADGYDRRPRRVGGIGLRRLRLTKLDLEAEGIEQADTARINITGAQPLDLYRIEVDGPGEFSPAPWVRADEHGNASVLLIDRTSISRSVRTRSD